jgi:c-di-GMP-binding flagellar brake protein YcgR
VGSQNANNFVRIGGRFVELAPEHEKIIQRFVTKMERELLRKHPKGG